jgi:hypothetical protein
MRPLRSSGCPSLVWPLIALAGASLAAATPRAAHASDADVRRVLPSPGDDIIKKLEFPPGDELEPEYERVPSGDIAVYVGLPGKYRNPHWTLLWGTDVITPDAHGLFRLRVPIHDPETLVNLVAVGPRGQVQNETVSILFPGYASYVEDVRPIDLKPTHFSGGIGVTLIAFSETATPDYGSISLTGKLTYAHSLFSPHWDVAVTGFMTLLPITDNSPEVARFVGLNFRAGYAFPQIQEPWRLSLLGGVYYTTMWVTHNAFGFRNLAGPQLFPTIRRALKHGQTISGYLKYSPINDGLHVLALSNRELAGGLAFALPLGNGHPFAVTFDAANLALSFGGVTISSTTFTLGAGYGF